MSVKRSRYEFETAPSTLPSIAAALARSRVASGRVSRRSAAAAKTVAYKIVQIALDNPADRGNRACRR